MTLQPTVHSLSAAVEDQSVQFLSSSIQKVRSCCKQFIALQSQGSSQVDCSLLGETALAAAFITSMQFDVLVIVWRASSQTVFKTLELCCSQESCF